MLGKILLSVALVAILTGTGDADKKDAILRRIQLRRRTAQGLRRLQQPPGAAGQERAPVRRPGFGSAISVLGQKHGEGSQADQNVDAPAPATGLPRMGGGRGGPRPGSGRMRTLGHGGLPRQNAMVQDEATPPAARPRFSRRRSGSSSPNLLASFAGKNRVLVISAPHASDGYYRMMMTLLKADVYCELAERHVHQLVLFHQEGEMGGKVRRVTPEGKVMEEPLDPGLIPRLMSFLKLEKGKFGMVLLRKTLQVEERYPYPVRLEAVYEVIDRSPMRRLEKLRQKGFVQKCKGAGVEGQVEEGRAAATPTDSYSRRERERERSPSSKPTPAGDNRTDKGAGGEPHGRNRASLVPAAQRPSKTKRKNGGTKPLSNDYDVKQKEVSEPPASQPWGADSHPEAGPAGRGKQDNINHQRRKKKKQHSDKLTRKGERRGGGKAGKKGGKKNGKSKSSKRLEKEVQKPTKKPAPPRGSLASFLEPLETRRRLLLITSPGEDSDMYVQQRDEYLESVCEMAFRKVTIITIFGALTNSTMKMDHYQLENDKPVTGMHHEDLVNQDLITELRKEFDMTHNDFYMVLTDTDMRAKRSYEAPIAMKAVFTYVDTFSSRFREMEQQKRDGLECTKDDKPRSLENFLSRFRWRRRLFVISAPNDEEWAYQQQLYALTSQACNLGLRHISILKLVGTEAQDMGGVLELYPINGSATVEREGLSAALVEDIRNYFQVSPEYFSMLLVGKDGNVKSWYPSPMWSMAIIYDLVDSMQLRRQEMSIQQSLGMRCPEDEYGGYGSSLFALPQQMAANNEFECTVVRLLDSVHEDSSVEWKCTVSVLRVILKPVPAPTSCSESKPERMDNIRAEMSRDTKRRPSLIDRAPAAKEK
ncbi:hypothetical protein NHX12_007141, partial [Muraenolepis orangiensis]